MALERFMSVKNNWPLPIMVNNTVKKHFIKVWKFHNKTAAKKLPSEGMIFWKPLKDI